MSPENLIERGRQSLNERREFKRATKELFNNAMDLLRAEGQPQRSLRIFTYQRLDFTVNSAQPPIMVSIKSGADLERARKIYIKIEGVGKIEVEKLPRLFANAEQEFSMFSWNWSLPPTSQIAQGFLDALHIVDTEMRIHHHSQAN